MKPLTYRHTRIACYGAYVTQAIINNLAPLLFTIFQRRFGVTLEEVGSLILINFTAQIFVDLAAARFADQIGYRNGMVIAHLFCIAGLAFLVVLPQILPSAFAGLLIAVIIYAVGGGYIEVLISPLVDSLPGEEKEKAMSLLHSFYCWGQAAVVLISTLLIWGLGESFWFLLPVLWALLPLCNTFLCAKVPVIEPKEQSHQPIPFKMLLKNKLFLIAVLMMLAAGASEMGMSQWSSLFAEKGLQVSKLMGDLLGPFLFAIFMAVGRTLYGFYGHKINLKNALLLCGLLCILCYGVTALSLNPLLSLAGCAVCGFGVSLLWPGTLSVTARGIPTGGTAMFGLLAVAGDMGCALGRLPHRSGVRLQPVPAGGGGAVPKLWYYAGAVWLKGRLGRGAAVPYPAGSGSPLLQKTESASGLVRAQGAYFWFRPGAGGGGTAGERVSGNFRADRNTMAKERWKTIRAAPAEDRRGQKRNTAFPRCNRPGG